MSDRIVKKKKVKTVFLMKLQKKTKAKKKNFKKGQN